MQTKQGKLHYVQKVKATAKFLETDDEAEKKKVERSFLKLTVPVGYQWVYKNGLNLSTGLELGVRYTLTDVKDTDKFAATYEKNKEKSFNFHVGLNLLNIGMTV